MTAGRAAHVQDEGARAAYYVGALVGLRFVEGRRPTNRRFGPDADARWQAFAGDLALADRMELLIRDADAEWPGAFGARMVFALDTVAEDDAFGPEWPGLHAPLAAKLWKAVLDEGTPAAPRATLERIAQAWELTLAPHEVVAIGPAEQLVVAGPSALAAVIERFADDADLDWADQVTCVASSPGARQLAALGAALTPGAKPTRLVRASSATTPAKSPKPRLVLSGDADPDDAAAARRLAGEEA